MDVLMRKVRRLARCAQDRGASAVEYGLMVAAIAAVIAAIVFSLGGLVERAFHNTCTSMATGPASLGDPATDCPSPNG